MNNNRNVWRKIKFANYEIIYYMFNNINTSDFTSIFFSIIFYIQIFSIPLSPLVYFIYNFFSFYQFGVKVNFVKN